MEIVFLLLGLACGMLIASKSQKDQIIERIQRVKMEPGDTAVLYVSRPVSNEEAAAIKRAWEGCFVENKVVVLGDGMEIRSVLSKS